jgi:hypothetical protein
LIHFLNPYMLWGLLAISIPVIIHLFNFRKHKKVYFSNVKYIQELKLQTQKQSRLRHLLVLLARILAIICLVLAFAQPFIPASTSVTANRSANVVSIYVDNSFSMQAEATNGELFSLARDKAKEIAMAYRSSDLFQLLTNDFEGRHQRLLSQEELLEMLGEIRLSPSVRPLSQVVLRQNELFAAAPAGNRLRFLLSDFQKSTSDFDQIPNDSLVKSFLLPLAPEDASNLYVDSCWFESPVHQLGQNVRLMVRIRSASSSDMEKIPVKLTVNGSQKALASFDIQAGSSTVVELPFTSHEAGIQFGSLAITDYPITFDDELFLAYVVQESIPVLNIHGDQDPVFLSSLMGHDSAFAYEAVSYKNVNYDRFSSYSLIILDGLSQVSSGLGQALAEFSANGGSLLVIPSVKMDLGSYQAFLQGIGVESYAEPVTADTRVSYLDLENPLFLDVFEGGSLSGKKSDSPVDLPAVKNYYPLKKSTSPGRISLMKMMNQDDFLTVDNPRGGPVYLLTVPLDDQFTNFQRHALFVPVIYRIALLSGASDPLYYPVGSNQVIALRNITLQGEDVVKVSNTARTVEFIPGQRILGSRLDLLLYDQVREAGHYRVTSGDSLVMGLAFNYDRRESDIACYDGGEIEIAVKSSGLGNFFVMKDDQKPLADSIEELSEGKRFWKLFIILALFFLGAEIFLLRLWSGK